MSTPNGTPHQDAPRAEFEQWVVNQIEELNDATNGTLLNQEAQLETLRRKVAWLDSRITDLVDQLNGWEVSVDLPSKLSKVSADIRDLRADMELVHRAFPTEIGEQRNVRALGPREQGPPESPEEQLDSFEAMREKVRVEAHADQDPIEYLLDQVASARTGFRLLRRKR